MDKTKLVERLHLAQSSPQLAPGFQGLFAEAKQRVTTLEDRIVSLENRLATTAAFSHWMWHALDDFAGENAQTGECAVEFPADDWKRCNELLDAIGEDPHETLHTILGIES